MINPYVFREYDIRGKVADDFPPDVVELLGKGFGTLVLRNGGREITLSGDIRLTTPDLVATFKKGVLSTGLDVINIVALLQNVPSVRQKVQCVCRIVGQGEVHNGLFRFHI